MFHMSRPAAALTLCLAWGCLAYAQIPTAPGLGSVDSSYVLGSSTFGSAQYTITILLLYNSNLAPNQYISPSQLTADYQGFLAAYPNPQDPPEAILFSAASSFAKKYPQFQLVSLEADSTSPRGQILASAGSLSFPGGLNSSALSRLGLRQLQAMMVASRALP